VPSGCSAQRHAPVHVPKPFVCWQGSAGAVTSSSKVPSQSSSFPLQVSGAGSDAEQSLQPMAGSHACRPAQVPWRFVRMHERVRSLSSGSRQVHEPVVGRQWRSAGASASATQSSPAPHSDSGVPNALSGPQSRAQYMAPSSGRQRSPGSGQPASFAHGVQVESTTGAHDVSLTR